MDDTEFPVSPEEVARLSDRDKIELQSFLQKQSQMAQIQKRMLLPPLMYLFIYFLLLLGLPSMK